jgi:hypothetical protein
MEELSSTKNMMKRLPITITGTNSPNTAVKNSYGALTHLTLSIGKPFSTGEKLDVNRWTHLLKYVYEWLPIGETLVRIDSTASPICPSCTNVIETHNHIYQCNNIHCQQITTDCLTQIGQINTKWRIPIHLATNISLQLRAWASNEQGPPITEAATNQTHLAALQTQARIGWGWFFKGFCANEFQQIINRQTNDPRNAFEQIRWTCEIVQCV